MHYMQKIFGLCDSLLIQEYYSLFSFHLFGRRLGLWRCINNMVKQHKLYVSEKNRVKKELLTPHPPNVLLTSYKLHQSRFQVWLQDFWKSSSERNTAWKLTVFLGIAYLTNIPYTIMSHIFKLKTILRPINLGHLYYSTCEPWRGANWDRKAVKELEKMTGIEIPNLPGIQTGSKLIKCLL